MCLRGVDVFYRVGWVRKVWGMLRREVVGRGMCKSMVGVLREVCERL